MLTDGKHDMHTTSSDLRILETLRECEGRTCLLSENIADVICTVDTALRITYVSKSVTRLLEYTPEEIKKISLEQLLRPASYKNASALFRKMLRSNCSALQPQVLELEYVTRSGATLWAEVKVTQLFDGNGKVAGLLGMARDITERHKAEDEKSRLETRLMQTQRLETVWTLAGGIAHDFNNLLMAILGNIDLALMDMTPSSPARSNLLEAAKASQRAADLCRQMLAYSGRGRFSSEAIDLN